MFIHVYNRKMIKAPHYCLLCLSTTISPHKGPMYYTECDRFHIMPYSSQFVCTAYCSKLSLALIDVKMQQVSHIPLLHPTQTNWHIGTSYYTDSPNTEKFANTANTCQEISTVFRHDMYLYEVTHSELTTYALQAWCCESLGTILILPYMNTPTAVAPFTNMV